jgi:hypothetical protein
MGVVQRMGLGSSNFPRKGHDLLRRQRIDTVESIEQELWQAPSLDLLYEIERLDAHFGKPRRRQCAQCVVIGGGRIT